MRRSLRRNQGRSKGLAYLDTAGKPKCSNGCPCSFLGSTGHSDDAAAKLTDWPSVDSPRHHGRIVQSILFRQQLMPTLVARAEHGLAATKAIKQLDALVVRMRRASGIAAFSETPFGETQHAHAIFNLLNRLTASAACLRIQGSRRGFVAGWQACRNSSSHSGSTRRIPPILT